MIDKPYCNCSKKRIDGWTHAGNQVWVHDKCRKVSYMVWLKTIYWEELDTIIERMMTGQEASDGLDKGRAEIACVFIAILEGTDIVKVRNKALLRFKQAESDQPVTA